MGRLVFFDVETGGLDPNRHAIIQIAAIACDTSNGIEEVEEFERKIQFPSTAATEEALQVNSYSKEVWDAEAIHPNQAEYELTQFLKGHATKQCVSRSGNPYQVAELAAHNGAAFDGPFLKQWYSRRDKFMPAWPIVYDTMQLALWKFTAADKRPENFKLETLAFHFGVDTEQYHDALGDVRATIEVTKKLLEL